MECVIWIISLQSWSACVLLCVECGRVWLGIWTRFMLKLASFPASHTHMHSRTGALFGRTERPWNRDVTPLSVLPWYLGPFWGCGGLLVLCPDLQRNKQPNEEQISAEMSRGNMAFTELHLTVLFASMLVATIIGSGLKNAAKLCKTWNNITNLRMLFVWVSWNGIVFAEWWDPADLKCKTVRW